MSAEVVAGIISKLTADTGGAGTLQGYMGTIVVYHGYPAEEKAISATQKAYIYYEVSRGAQSPMGAEIQSMVPPMTMRIWVVSEDPYLNLQIEDRVLDLLLGRQIDTTNFKALTLRYQGSDAGFTVAQQFTREMTWEAANIKRKTALDITS